MRTVLALVLATAAPLAAAAPPAPYADAPLYAVQFADRHEGWAAGAEGVVWHTIDGGATWERQPTGTRAALRAVHFLNPYTGWAVGREELPYGGGSAGVVLVTRDGGLKWTRLTAGSLPGLHAVKFFDEANGLAAGDGSDHQPGGLFATADGGKTWKPVPGPRGPGWRAADFSDPRTGAIVGAWGRLATLRGGTLGAADVDTLGGRSLAAVRLDGPRAFAAGEGGLVLTSADSAGVRWGYADVPLPAEALAACDFRGIAVLDQHVWVVGRPGSVVLHSADRGKTWEVQATGQTLPLHAVAFTDREHGWAVGELGTVLATADGGKTWAVQRQGGQRLAVLGVHDRPEGVPAGVVAALGGGDGYLTGVLRVVAADPATAAPRCAAEPMRLGAAVRRAGGAAAEALWQFPRPGHLDAAAPAQLVAAWDERHNGTAGEEVLRQLVLALRVWRPEVVLADAAGVSAEAAAEASKRAADPAAFPEQVRHLGLTPWAVKKVYACSDKPDAPVALDLATVVPALGDAPADFAAPAAALLADAPGDAPGRAAFRLVTGRIAGADRHVSLMEGIDLGPGGTARREPVALTQEDAEELEERKKAVNARRALVTLMGTAEGTAGLARPDGMLAQVGPVLDRLPEDQAAAAAHAVARQLARSGQWPMAREMFLLMADRYPAHPLAADAYRWLLTYQASGEARRRHELGQFRVVGETSYRPAAGPGRAPELQLVRHLSYLSDTGAARRWYEGSLEVEPRLAGFGSLYVNDPGVQFPVAAARRTLGRFDDARKWYSAFLARTAAANAKPDAWREAAAQEAWLADRNGPPPRPVGTCRMTAMRPFLDGLLGDECWKGLTPMPLRDASGATAGDSGTQAFFAYDKDFFYVAVRCKHPKAEPAKRPAKRTRDADLSGQDRVEVLLDLDRDYRTAYRLRIDRRGCPAEDCWGDASWDPRWFVAVASDAEGWTAEAAIPISELVAEAPALNTTWACNVTRVLPGRGVQGWSLPAGVEPRPEGMGSLVFTEPEAAGGK